MKGVKYIEQIDDDTCSSVALFNATRWWGIDYKEKTLNNMRGQLQIDEGGPNKNLFGYFIKKVYFTDHYKEHNKLNMSIVDNALDAEHIVIASIYHKNEQYGHLFLVVEKRDQKYRVINLWCEDFNDVLIKRSYLVNVFRKCKKDYPFGWEIFPYNLRNDVMRRENILGKIERELSQSRLTNTNFVNYYVSRFVTLNR